MTSLYEDDVWLYWYNFDSEGYDKQGYNSFGYNRDGYDRDGFNTIGYSRNGINKYGYMMTKVLTNMKSIKILEQFIIKKGFNVYDDKNKYTINDYDMNRFYDKYIVYDWQGYTEDGYNKKGFDKQRIQQKNNTIGIELIYFFINK